MSPADTGEASGIDAPRDAPELPAVEVVALDETVTGRHDLGAQRVLPDERRRPGRCAVERALLDARDAPDVRAGLRVERRQERLALAVLQQVDAAGVRDRRRAGAEVEVDRLRRPARFQSSVPSSV